MAEHLAAQVPSVIIPAEFNVLLNPNHSSYDKIRWSEPRPFRFDPRLFIIGAASSIARQSGLDHAHFSVY